MGGVFCLKKRQKKPKSSSVQKRKRTPRISRCETVKPLPPPLSEKTGILEFWAKKCHFSFVNQALTRFQSTGIFWNLFQNFWNPGARSALFLRNSKIPERFQQTGTELECWNRGENSRIPERFQQTGTELESWNLVDLV